MSSTTHPTTQTTPPRPSTETERTLIPDAASEETSSSSILSLQPESQLYRGFPSQEAYLAALHEWAESKKFVEQDTSLVGFYGDTTMETLANKPKMEFGISKRLKQRRASKDKNEAAGKKSRGLWTLGLKKASRG